MSDEKSKESLVEIKISPGTDVMGPVVNKEEARTWNFGPWSCPLGIPCVVELWRMLHHVKSTVGQATFL